MDVGNGRHTRVRQKAILKAAPQEDLPHGPFSVKSGGRQKDSSHTGDGPVKTRGRGHGDALERGRADGSTRRRNAACLNGCRKGDM